MDRQIVYPGAIPLETDLLNTNKFAMIGLAKLASAILGSGTVLYGLQCRPATLASLEIIIGPGQIYSLQNIDNSAYSSLKADTKKTVLKQGLISETTTLKLTAPAVAGHCINYLVQVAYEDLDTGEAVLPYYNAENPSVAFSGPGNSGKALPGVRSGRCRVALKPGISSPSGSQTTPQPDEGYVAAWGISVSSGSSAITAADISMINGAPFLPSAGVYSAIQQGACTFAPDTGSANHYIADYKPALAALVDGVRLTFKAREANSGPCTFTANGGKAYPLLSHAHQELQGGEIINGGLISVQWNSALSAWLMCGNTGGAVPVSEALHSHHALSLGQADERYSDKASSFSKEEAEKDFLPVSGGALSGNLSITGDLHADKVSTDAIHILEGGSLYGPGWGTEKDEKSGSLTVWLKAELEKLQMQISKLPSRTYVTEQCVCDVRLGAEKKITSTEIRFKSGYLLTGWVVQKGISNHYDGYARPLQILIGDAWRTIRNEE